MAADVGAFRIDEPVGRGATGEVWRGVHLRLGQPVAIKILGADQAHDERARADFRREARSMAGLDHPSIVTVFDYGELPRGVDGADPRLVPGRPYLVMEWADSTLRERSRLRDFWQLRGILIGLLDALAHAHARGVVHRDLKLGNVLLSGSGGSTGELKLADFGLARHEDENDSLSGAGTPTYMAPEQIGRRRHDQGPWTDLYALGCMAYRLCSGAFPFHHRERDRVQRAHLHDPVPALEPRFPVPDDFEAWLGWLLRKAPRDRFQSAADAAYALVRLGVPDGGRVPEDLRATLRLDALPSQIWELPTSVSDPPTDVSGDGGAHLVATPAATPRERPPWGPPPMPSTHRRTAAPRRSALLFDAGLGLYDLRTVPLVDRDGERDVLWTALVHASATSRPHVVALHGPSGLGKSRLARWLRERAHEVGAATSLTATYRVLYGPGAGLSGMLARHFRCEGAAPAEARARIRDALRAEGADDAYEWEALGQIVAPSDDARVRFSSPAERYEAVRRHLLRLGRERPLVVCLEGAHWGVEALAFTQHVLDRATEAPLPAALVLTLDEEPLRARPAIAELLDRALAGETARRIEVGPLPQPHRSALIRELLGLRGDVAALVEERTHGNPLFAIQLVGDWIRQRVLVPTEDGFALGPGLDRPPAPQDLVSVWGARLDSVLEERPRDAPALELAAVLGLRVDAVEWRRACEAATRAAPSGLVEALLRAGLARPDGEGFTFAHGMLREVLVAQAGRSGRLRDHHAACARMLDGSGAEGAAERVARHLAQAGDHDAAAPRLLEAADARRAAGDYDVAELLLAERRQSLDAMGVSASDRRVAEGDLMLGAVLLRRGHFERGEALLTAVECAATAQGWPALEAEALLHRGIVDAERGEVGAARARLERAIERADRLDRPELAAMARVRLAYVLDRTGDRAAAEHAAREALAGALAAGADELAAHAVYWWGVILSHDGQLDAAREHERNARARYEACGSRLGLARCASLRGELALARRDHGSAEEAFGHAVEHYRAIGHWAAELHETQVAIAIALDGRATEAQPLLHAAARRLAHRNPSLRRYVALAQLLCDVEQGDLAVAAEQLEELGRWLRESADIEPESAYLAEAIARAAGRAGDRRLGTAAWELARDLWSRAGRHDEAAEATLKLADA